MPTLQSEEYKWRLWGAALVSLGASAHAGSVRDDSGGLPLYPDSILVLCPEAGPGQLQNYLPALPF